MRRFARLIWDLRTFGAGSNQYELQTFVALVAACVEGERVNGVILQLVDSCFDGADVIFLERFADGDRVEGFEKGEALLAGVWERVDRAGACSGEGQECADGCRILSAMLFW